MYSWSLSKHLSTYQQKKCKKQIILLDNSESLIYKLVLFREGQLYVNEEAKANFTFPKTTDSTFAQIKECKRVAMESGLTVEEAYVKLRKLFLLKKGYDNAPTATIQDKVAEIRNYKRNEEMTMKEIELRNVKGCADYSPREQYIRKSLICFDRLRLK